MSLFRCWPLLGVMYVGMALGTPMPAYWVDDAAAVDTTDPVVADTKDTEHERDILLLDWSRQKLATYVEGLNDGLDSLITETFFSDEVDNENWSGSYGKLFFYTRREFHQPVDYQSGINLNLALPHTNDQLKLLVESEENNDDQRESDALGTVDNVTYTTALRFLIRDAEDYKASWDNGVRWEGEPVPFSRLRFQRIDYYEACRTRFYQTLYWRTNTGWGADTSYQVRTPLDLQRQFIFSLNANYLLNNDYYDLSNTWAISDEWNADEAMLYGFSIIGDTQQYEKVTNYVTSARYRRMLYKKFVFGEIEPELSWPREHNFEPVAAIIFRLEFIFSEGHH